VTSNEGGTGNTASASLTVVQPPTAGTSFAASSIPLNGTTTLTFTIGNPAGNTALSGIAFTDSLPAGLVVASPNGLSDPSPGGGTATAAAGSSTVSLSGATLAPGGSFSFSVSVRGATAGVKNNSVTVTSAEGGNAAPANASVTVVAPPSVTAQQVNDGAAQRSRVIELKVTFDRVVSLPADHPEQAFALTDANGNPVANVTLGVTVDNSSGVSVATITFGGSAIIGASLADGRYVLRTLASQVTDSIGQHLAADATLSFFRLFGDATGDGKVNNSDFVIFATAFGKLPGQGYLSYLDYDGSGTINNTDFVQFALRFGVILP
jgi:uncharacterized repeat protein (TIGR01451 family)